MTESDFARAVMTWYDERARDLPWRAAGATAWGVLVSEVMLQQTPVGRVLPAWSAWMLRWPTPAALAASSGGDAVRAWDRLGYPRRALRLHAAATVIGQRHAGEVPSSYDALLRLPGVGAYTAAAVASFSFGARLAVLDTNVRRVYARVFDGCADATGSPTRAERATAQERVPAEQPARYSVAVMELGALVCTARSPHCPECPVAASCRWLDAGRPPARVRRPTQGYAGTDRQARGRLLAVLREADRPVPAATLDVVWNDVEQRRRALASLLADGLVEAVGADRFQLPG